MSNHGLHSMASQDPALDSFYEDVVEAGHEEEIDNKERGCGHLKHNAAYVRSDVQALSSAEGTVPRFVELDTPVEYREHGDRGAIIPGWRPFPGVQFATAYRNEGFTTSPPGALELYENRMENLRFDGDHYGEITVARSHDLLMSVGATHWSTAEEYIAECRDMGLNLKIPSGPSNEPPVVNPMVTRCWVVHPDVYDGRAAIIGYAVLTRTLYTTGENATADDPDIPSYAQEWAETGKVSLATPGQEVSAEDGRAQPGIGDFTDADAVTHPDSVFASDKEGRDVEAASADRLREMDDDEVAEVEETLSDENTDVEIEADDEDVPVERQPGYQNAPEEMYETPEDRHDHLPEGEEESEEEVEHPIDRATAVVSEAEHGDPEFWEDYDIPFEFATAQNNRLSELQRGSTGTGATESTVRHLYVLEDFEDGQLKRTAGDLGIFLCKGEGNQPDRPQEQATNPRKITCSECLERMERWKTTDEVDE